LKDGDFSVDKKKAQQLHHVFQHIKTEDGRKKFREDPASAVPGADRDLLAVFADLDDDHLRLLAEVNDKLYDAGFGVSDSVRVSMV
jgi:hypothetical protein